MENTKRKSKDSVFTVLFSDKKNILRLYKDLHPEDTDVTIDDIADCTIESIMINRLLNDLGFTVKDRIVVLIEAQSTWSSNITLRLLMYLVRTYSDWLNRMGMSLHSYSKLPLPRPELYIVYTGSGDCPDVLSLNEEYFGGTGDLDLRVRVLKDVNVTLWGQYVGFCKVFDEQRKLFGNSRKCAEETVRICIEKGYLADFFKEHKAEVIDMLDKLFDEEYQREMYDRSRDKAVFMEGVAKGEAIGIEKGIAKGEAIGIEKGRAEERAKSIKEMAANLRNLGIPEEIIRKAISGKTVAAE